MEQLGLKQVNTGVDRLIAFLKGRGMVDMSDASAELGISPDVLQSWVDFLVEEQIVGIEYKFTKPFIYYVEKTPGKVSKELFDYRKKFVDAAKKKDVPGSKTEFLWKNHMLQEVEAKKEFFFQQASLRNLVHVDELWQEYKKRIGA